MTINKLLFCLIIGLLLWGCAQQGTPTGGPKDSASPQIIKSEPQNFSTGFTGKKIKLYFNEFVKTKNLQSLMLITPSLNTMPEVQLKTRRLDFVISDTLKENTTYYFNFGNGIVDVTEDNPLDSNIFVFSTGAFLDSLSISGVVKDAWTMQPSEDTYVMLYEERFDSVPYQKRPFYMAKTNKSGHYHMGYLKPGNYKSFCLKDLNANYLFDSDKEEIAFKEDLITSGDSLPIDYFLFKETPKQTHLLKSESGGLNLWILSFNKGVEGENWKFSSNFESAKDFFIYKNETKDSIWVWRKKSEMQDTITAYLDIPGEPLDTIIMIQQDTTKKSVKKRPRKGSSNADNENRLEVKIELKGSELQDLFSPFGLSFNKPVFNINRDLISMFKDESAVEFKIEVDSIKQLGVRILHSWEEGSKYEIKILPGAFQDICGFKNDSILKSFRIKPSDEYSDLNLKLDFENLQNPLIFHLVNIKGKVLFEQSVKIQDEVKIKNISKGSYTLRLIQDENNNGKWDTGDYLRGIQPEKVLYYQKKIEIKEGFDSDLSWSNKMEKSKKQDSKDK